MVRRGLWYGIVLSAGVTLSGASAIAQQVPANVRVGYLSFTQVTNARLTFDDTLRRLGWVEGRNLVLDRRFVGDVDRYARAAAELVAAHPDVLVGVGGQDVLALRGVTRTIPIVFITVSDPVVLGFAESLARPGGNVTGISAMTPELEVKQLELLRGLVPGAKRISMLRNANNPGSAERFVADAAAVAGFGITLVRRDGDGAGDIDAAFAAAAAERDDAIHIEFSAKFLVEKDRIIGLAARYRLPAVFGVRDFAEAGGLLSYGPNYRASFKRAAELVDKILRGARPSDIPVEQPTHFELVINLVTAKALGLTIPLTILAGADDVID